MVLNRGEEAAKEEGAEEEVAAAETSTENGERTTVTSILFAGGEGERNGSPLSPPSLAFLASEQASSPLAKSQEGSSKGASSSEITLPLFFFFPLVFFPLFFFFFSAALSLNLATPHFSDTENSSSPSSSPSSGCVAAIWRREAEKREKGEVEEVDARSGTENFEEEEDEKRSTTSYSLFPPLLRKHHGTAEFSSAGIQQQQPAETQLGWSEAPSGHCSRGPAGSQSGGEEEAEAEVVEVEVEKNRNETRKKKEPPIKNPNLFPMAFLALFRARPLICVYKRMIYLRVRSCG